MTSSSGASTPPCRGWRSAWRQSAAAGISELCELRWRDVDLAAGWITVGDSKMDAGRRRVKIRGALHDELLALRGRHLQAPQSAYVFGTLSGGRMSPDNFRSRVLGRPAVIVDGEGKAATGAVGRANKRLEAEGLPPLPGRITPHSLRRTFCSLLNAQLAALVEGADWANNREPAPRTSAYDADAAQAPR